MDESLKVRGYQFLTADDADKARLDGRKIDYLKSHTTAMQDANALGAVYQKAIDSKVFTTPVGWSYLWDLRSQMIALGTPEDSISPIPVKLPMNPSAVQSVQQVTPVTVQAPVEVEKRKATPLHIVSYIANAVLLLLVIAMFIVAYLGETNNILNYKRNLTNQYSAWEEQLREREAAVREKETELGITSTP